MYINYKTDQQIIILIRFCNASYIGEKYGEYQVAVIIKNCSIFSILKKGDLQNKTKNEGTE